MNSYLIIVSSILYLLLLFGVGYYAEIRSAKQKSIINNPYIYALSLAVYCTAWTFYGSVGRATLTGIEYLYIYLGPTVMDLYSGSCSVKLYVSPRHTVLPVLLILSAPATGKIFHWE